MVLMNLTPPDVSANILNIGSPGQDNNTSCTCINNSLNNSCSFII